MLSVYANGEFAVIHSPDSVKFTLDGEIEQSNLKEILCALLGYTAKEVYVVIFNLSMKLFDHIDSLEYCIVLNTKHLNCEKYFPLLIK